MLPAPRITVAGVTEDEAAEVDSVLQSLKVPAAEAHLEKQGLPPHKLGEPATFLLIAYATSLGFGVLATFLNKRRRKGHLRLTVTVENPDGSKRTEALEGSWSDSESPSPELVEKLSSMTKLSSDEIKGLLH
jgi:hypothetical protein